MAKRYGWLAFLIVVASCAGNATDTTVSSTTILESVGDSERGRDIWATGGGVLSKPGCVHCHSIDGSEHTDNVTRLAPSWLGTSQLAAERVPGQSAEEYLRESIMSPGAFIVDGYEDRMLSFRYALNDDDLESLIAFILQL
jgi:cytochrome c oxidase subunit 2